MILAEVNSGRSDFDSSSPTKRRERRDRRHRRGILHARRAALAGRRERRGAHRDDLSWRRRLHGLDGIAGIDRPLERVGRDHLDDFGNLHDVEQRGDARHDVLAVRRRRRDDRVIAAGERDDQRGERLGEHVLVEGGVGEQHLLDAVELGGGIRHRLAVLAGDQHMHVAAERLGRGERLGGRVLERLVIVLGDEKRGHLEHPRFLFELADQLGHRADLDAGLASRRLDRLDHLQPRRDVDAVVGRRLVRRSASSSPS